MVGKTPARNAYSLRSATRQLGELHRQSHHPRGELVGALRRDSGMTHREATGAFVPIRHVGFCSGIGDERQVAIGCRVREHDGVRGAAVEPLLDRSHPTGRGDLQQPGIDQHIDVMGDGATWLAYPLRQFGHRHRMLQDQVEDEGAQRIADRLQSRGSVGADGRVKVVAELIDGSGAFGEPSPCFTSRPGSGPTSRAPAPSAEPSTVLMSDICRMIGKIRTFVNNPCGL